jgi:selenide,water dikinase
MQSIPEIQKYIMCDPQTSGGLLLAVAPESTAIVEEILGEAGLINTPIGIFVAESGGSPILQVRS